MLKFLKANKIGLLLVVFLVANPIRCFAREGDCLYKAQAEKYPPGMVGRAIADGGISYFLKNGTYVSVLNWNCRRVGQRIFIVVPAKFDDPKYVAELLASQSEKEIAQAIPSLIKNNRKDGRSEIGLELYSYEFGSLTIDKSFYETIYTVLYYTSD